MSKSINIEGMTKDEAITALIADHGMTFKEANTYWVENRPARGTGFKARFYAELENGPMSDARFEELIAGESENIQKHKSAHDNVRALANALWAKK